MAQFVPTPSETAQSAAALHPRIIRGADDQAAAYDEWLARWTDVDSQEDEDAWRRVEQNLQETRRELGQRLLFSE